MAAKGIDLGLEGQVAVITGGAGILCSTMAGALADHGVKIALLDIAEEPMKGIRQELQRKTDCLAIKASVLSKPELQTAAARVLNEFQRVDILINCAGGNKAEATTSEELEFFELPEDAVRFVFDLNFMGTFLACQVFGRIMANRDKGVILNVSSMNAFRPLTRIPAYSAAKAAVSNFTQWLAVHMAQNYSNKIRVNAIAPGFFITAQNRYLLLDENDNLTPRGKQILEHTPMGRFGEPRDLVGTVLWLVSPLSEFVSGTVIPIDGGFSAYSGV